MSTIVAFTQADKAVHNSHKFGFKLSSTNYGFWKTMIQPFLITNNLFGYIDGTVSCPSSTVLLAGSSSDKDKEPTATTQVNPEYTTWVSNDAHVRMIVLSTISESAFQHVQGVTSRELWLALERAYAPHTASREYTLKTQLLKIQMKPDESSSAYLTRAQEYSDALANIGEPMKEKDVVMLVLSGLREEYNGFKSTILARQVPIAFVDLHALLLDHDYMISKNSIEVNPAQAFTAAASIRKPVTTTGPSQVSTDAVQAIQQLAAQLGFQLQPIGSQQPQAHYTNRSQNNRDRTQNNRSGNSTNNRGRGNYNNRNQGGGTRNQFSWASNQNTVYGTCNRCGIGHVPSQCPNRDPSTFRSRQAPSANFADSRSQSSSTWLPDTGSSHHVASHLSSFDTSEASMARIIFMLVTVRVYPFYTLDLPAFIHLTKHSTLNTFYMFQPLQKISFLFNSFVTTVMFILNFILPIFL